MFSVPYNHLFPQDLEVFSREQPGESEFYLASSCSLGGQIIFRDVQDVREYCEEAVECFGRARVRIHAFAFLADSVHWLLNGITPDYTLQRGWEKTARVFGLLQGRYARARMVQTAVAMGRQSWLASREKGRRCRMWSSRGLKYPVLDQNAGPLARKIEMLPVEAGLVERPEDYVFSSCRAHLGYCSVLPVDRARFAELLPIQTGEPRPFKERWRSYLALDLERARGEAAKAPPARGMEMEAVMRAEEANWEEPTRKLMVKEMGEEAMREETEQYEARRLAMRQAAAAAR